MDSAHGYREAMCRMIAVMRQPGALRRILVNAGMTVAVLGAGPAPGAVGLRYDVYLDTLDAARVEVRCEDCSQLPTLHALSNAAVRRLQSTTLEGWALHEKRLSPAAGQKRASYVEAFHGDGAADRVITGRSKAVLVTDPREWLWVPDSWSHERPLEVAFHLPEGIEVATPWPLVRGTDEHYTVVPWLRHMDGAVVFAPMTRRAVPLGEAVVRISVVGAAMPRADEYATWVVACARALADTFGRFPVPLTQVVVMPVARAREPVPFGHVVRGLGNTVILYIDPVATLAELQADWTLTHELSHLAHPFLGEQGRWLAEGLAGYYQNVARARSGVLTAATATANLQRSFTATAKEDDRGPIDEAGRMRTYWTGAVMALDMDIQLAAAKGRFPSLAAAMGEFARHNLPSSRAWRPDDYMAELDRLGGTRIFSTTYQRYFASTEFPPFAEAISRAADTFTRQNHSSNALD
ncbi:hypothetical protein [Tahibacter amnicola]|uniref:Peptidase M61 catalytic domain-containing protein n=1 Tax=Tahibacter amnicola TaxID=2976241 RepID=A0ABY6BNC9_9GAMM|nr:hypothetical protein [Tahibacter amnicola]UXI70565.1 hypothetical protein N4264_13265 [Tahibacter amnicola]